MLVMPTGGRLWRFRYRHRGVEKLFALGQYPDVTLKRAREKRNEARRVVADGVDPSAKRQAEKASADTFQAIASEWLGLQSKARDTWDSAEKLSVPLCRLTSCEGDYCAGVVGGAAED